MDPLVGIFGLLVVVLTIGIVILIIKSRSDDRGVSQNLERELASLREEMRDLHFKNGQDVQQQLRGVNDMLFKGLSDQERSNATSHQAVNQQFAQTARIIQDVTSKLTLLDATNKQVLDFSSQLKSLQDILKNPKQRGILGEYYLEMLLKNTLAPDSFAMQYRLGVDEAGKDLIPDAVVFVKEKIIPVDSKFSLENYNRIVEEQNETERARLEKVFIADLKNRIIETSKYIRPERGTMDFAFMFIPHEAIYYDLLVNRIGALQEETENLIQRAASKHHVIIVSPTSFLAYLQTVLQALRALKIEETAQDIIKHVGELGKHFQKYGDYHARLGKNLSTVIGQYNDSSGELRKIGKDVMRITSGNAAEFIEFDEAPKPLIEN